jgi:hypothetical protein
MKSYSKPRKKKKVKEKEKETEKKKSMFIYIRGFKEKKGVYIYMLCVKIVSKSIHF